MSSALVGLYGIYFVLVGIYGNSDKLLKFVEDNGKDFLVWILAIVVLAALYRVKAIRPAVKPFIALAVLVFVLKNWSTISAQLNYFLPANVKIPDVKS
jgi:hypothetical protein